MDIKVFVHAKIGTTDSLACLLPSSIIRCTDSRRSLQMQFARFGMRDATKRRESDPIAIEGKAGQGERKDLRRRHFVISFLCTSGRNGAGVRNRDLSAGPEEPGNPICHLVESRQFHDGRRWRVLGAVAFRYGLDLSRFR